MAAIIIYIYLLIYRDLLLKKQTVRAQNVVREKSCSCGQFGSEPGNLGLMDPGTDVWS